ncbi:MAG TPA: hypothetical protein VL989_01430 [Candidatus Sulfotelmatobacter sp.]|nr:hypothetical protein [Candidatus Sulfotelmatobacter sp.]
MEPNKSNESNTPKKSGGYGKRPVWQWVLLYVVVAIVVYGIIYLIFIHKSGSSSGSSSSGY